MTSTTNPAYPVPLSDQELASLGRLCVVWGHFEFLVELAFNHFDGETFNAARLLQRAPNITERLSVLLKQGAAQLSTIEQAKLTDLCSLGAQLALRRNLAVHGWWGFDVDRPGHAAASSWFRVPTGEPLKTFHGDKLGTLVEDVGALGRELRLFLEGRGYLPVAQY